MCKWLIKSEFKDDEQELSVVFSLSLFYLHLQNSISTSVSDLHWDFRFQVIVFFLLQEAYPQRDHHHRISDIFAIIIVFSSEKTCL